MVAERDDRYRPWRASTLEAVARILGQTDGGLSNSEIDRLLARCGLPDPGSGTKWKRIATALEQAQQADGSCQPAVNIITASMSPQTYIGNQRLFADRRDRLNEVLVFEGLKVTDEGKVAKGPLAKTLSEAAAHAGTLRLELERRGTHVQVLRYCTTELLERNTFHAMLEATKSVAARLREMTGFGLDGAALAREAFLGDSPKVAVTPPTTETDKGEQRAFGNLVIGVFGLFRNPHAHDPRIDRAVADDDLLDGLTILSMIHRRLDRASVMP